MPTPAGDRPGRLPRLQAGLGPIVRRHRRALAAVCAGAAVLVVLTSMTAPPADPRVNTPLLRADQVAMPVALATAGQPITVGTLLDIVAVPEDGVRPWIVSRGNTVLAASTLMSSGSSVLLAVTEPEALQIADAASRGTLTALLHDGGVSDPAQP